MFNTSSGSDTITALTILLSDASSTSKLEVTSDDGTTVYGSSTNPTGSTTLITLTTSITATSTTNQYKLRITPKTQTTLATGTAGMLYPVTAKVFSWTGSLAQAGSDSSSAIVTIDNQPPATTGGSGLVWATSTSLSNIAWRSVTYGNGMFVAVPCANFSVSSPSSCSSSSGSGTLATSPDGITWTIRNPALTNSSWQSVTYGNGIFVAIADSCATSNNCLMTSSDGINWTGRVTVVANSWQSVTYGNGLFVAVAYSGTGNRVMTSPDGINWTIRTSAADNSWRSVAYGNGLFVAVSSTGTGNRVMTSPDGINWTIRTSATDNSWQSVTYGNGLFVAVAQTGTGNFVMTSPDGINWTSRTDAFDATWKSVAYGNGLFIATACSPTAVGCNVTSGNRVMTSPDGITWATNTSAMNDSPWLGVVYGNGTFVAVSSMGTTTNAMYSTSTLPTATPGNTQATISYITPGDSDLNSMLILASTSPIVDVPVDGTTYATGTVIGGARVACLDTTVTASTSDNCIATNLTNATPYYFKVFAKDQYGNYSTGLATVPASVTPSASATSTIMTTGTDPGSQTIAPGAGATFVDAFTLQTSAGTDSITSLNIALSNASSTSLLEVTDTTGSTVYGSSSNPTGNVIYMGLTTPLPVTTSATTFKIRITPKSQANLPSGSLSMSYPVVATVFSWNGTNLNQSGTDNTSSEITIDNEMQSTTGEDVTVWASTTSSALNSWTSVTYGNGLFVAVAWFGTGNRVMTSPDGINWTIRTTPIDNAWYAVTYGNGLFVAVSDGQEATSTNVMTSPDGITWTVRNSAANNQWLSVIYGNGLFVAVADSGTGNRVMTSSDGITWTIGTSAADNNWNSVVYGKGLFVAVSTSGSGNNVMTSPDGINWTIRQTATGLSWKSIAYGNGLFVAVAVSGGGDRVMTSPDGITWTVRPSAAGNVWYSITYGNGFFVAVSATGSGNRVMTSPDGLTWTAQSSAANNVWYSITYGNGRFVAVSSSANIETNSSVIPSATPGNNQVIVSYTTPAESDLNSMVVLRSTSAVVDFPVDGTTYSVGNTVGASTVACVDTTVSTSTSDFCTDSTPTNGTTYYYKVFAKDSRGNYSSGLATSPVSVTPNAAATQMQVNSYRFRRDDGSETGASFYAAENTAVSANFFVSDITRLRFVVSNQGTATTSMSYQIEYATSSCSVWTTVPKAQTATFEHFRVDSSSYVYDGQATTHLAGMTAPGGKSFVAGKIQTYNNITTPITLSPSQYTEIEYSLRSTSKMNPGTTYCFRVSDFGDVSGLSYVATSTISAYNQVFRPNAGGGGGGGAAGGLINIDTPSTGTTTTSGGSSLGGVGSSTESSTTPSAPKSGGGNSGGSGDLGYLYHGSKIASLFQKTLDFMFGQTVSAGAGNAYAQEAVPSSSPSTTNTCALKVFGVCLIGNLPGMKQ
jgi:predicted RecA/RadA family phage recombinase